MKYIVLLYALKNFCNCSMLYNEIFKSSDEVNLEEHVVTPYLKDTVNFDNC